MTSTDATNGSLLILYAANSVFTPTVVDYLNAFKEYSRYRTYYANAVQRAELGPPLDFFDAVFVHYSVRLSLPGYFSREFSKALENYPGPKILSIQDEYENTEQARIWIEKLKFDTVLTCVPSQYIDSIYPATRFPDVKFVNVLTGYAPSHLTSQLSYQPIASRPVHIGYRGRRLHYLYGELGYEKELIGTRVRELAESHQITVDIETSDEHRIYGDQWFQFIKSCKTMLGSESGSNIFDFVGDLRSSIDEYLELNPSADFSTIKERFIQDQEGKFAKMNQISPKLFEAIASKTGLVLFEGNYSDILKAGVHYIALKKDFSNWHEVVEKIENDSFLQEMVDRTYIDIIESGRWSYHSLIQRIDHEIERLLTKKSRRNKFDEAVYSIVGIGNQAFPPNCFSSPVSSAFIQKFRIQPAHWKTTLARRIVESEFDLSKAAGWLQLAWISLVSENSRKKISPRIKRAARNFFRVS